VLLCALAFYQGSNLFPPGIAPSVARRFGPSPFPTNKNAKIKRRPGLAPGRRLFAWLWKLLLQLEPFGMLLSTDSMNSLSQSDCEPCQGEVRPLAGAELAALQQELGRGWQVVNGHHLEKLFRFKDFSGALQFTNQIGEIAEAAGHHPDIYLTWGKVRVEVFTHSANGLTRNDFVLAAKIEDAAPRD